MSDGTTLPAQLATAARYLRTADHARVSAPGIADQARRHVRAVGQPGFRVRIEAGRLRVPLAFEAIRFQPVLGGHPQPRSPSTEDGGLVLLLLFSCSTAEPDAIVQQRCQAASLTPSQFTPPPPKSDAAKSCTF
jgi:hypothetical protein